MRNQKARIKHVWRDFLFILMMLGITANIAYSEDYKGEDSNIIKVYDQHNNKAGHVIISNYTAHPIVLERVINCASLDKFAVEAIDNCTEVKGVGVEPGHTLEPGADYVKYQLVHDDHGTGGHALQYAIKNYNGQGDDYQFFITMTRTQHNAAGVQDSELYYGVKGHLRNETTPNAISQYELVKEYGIYFSAGWNWDELGKEGPSTSEHNDAYYVTISELPFGCKNMKTQRLIQPVGCFGPDKSCSNSDHYTAFSKCKDFKKDLYSVYSDE